MQIIVWLLTGNMLAGALFGAAFFVGREHTQAEYRAINRNFAGKRSAMPWYEGFKPTYWSLDSVLDLLFPVIAVSLVTVIYWKVG